MVDTEAYTLASQKWEGPVFCVVDQSGHEMIDIPLEFAKKGRCNTIAFAMAQLNSCFEEPGHLQAGDGRVLDNPIEPLFAGIATFVRSDQTENRCMPIKGPRFDHKDRIPDEGSDDGSATTEPPSLPYNEQHFWEGLAVRSGGVCPLSGDDYAGCSACHILPPSKLEVRDCLRAKLE